MNISELFNTQIQERLVAAIGLIFFSYWIFRFLRQALLPGVSRYLLRKGRVKWAMRVRRWAKNSPLVRR